MTSGASQNCERSVTLTAGCNKPASNSLPGTRIIGPAAQGDYDGLCGLYCLINAIRLVMAPYRELRLDEARSLFATGILFLEKRDGLPKAVRSCVRQQHWPKLAQRLVTATHDIAGFAVVLDHPGISATAPIEETLRHMEKMIDSGMAPCVFLRGGYRHYSVISGYTPASLMLFDSFGYHRVRRASCGTTAMNTSLHRFHTQSLLTVAAARTGRL